MIILTRLLLTLTLLPLIFASGARAADQEEQPKANFPETEVFLFDLVAGDDGFAIRNGRNISQRAGYDNQPYFTKDSDTLVYSRGDDYQTDVYEYSLTTGESTPVTQSPNTEFSPTPGPDDATIAFVSDRNSSLWLANRDDPNNPTWVLAHLNLTEPIGYFGWNRETGFILYWSQFGHSVSLVHESQPIYQFISGHAVPSTPHVIPATNRFSFVHRQTNGEVLIKELDPETYSIRPLVSLSGSNSNYCWTPDGHILIIQGETLYSWSEAAADGGWQEVADLTEHGLASANRVAISPDGKKLAVVGLPVEKY